MTKPYSWWDQWVGHPDGTVVMRIKNLLHFRRRRVDLHKMVTADLPGCFHTHPAFAIRIVLWNGYVEEVLVNDLSEIPLHAENVQGIWDYEAGRWKQLTYTRRIKPWHIGLVRPSLTHRIAELPNGPNYSLWLRGRVRYPILLFGDGWPPEMRHTSRKVQDETL